MRTSVRLAILLALGLSSLPCRAQVSPTPSGLATIEILDVGQGDSILIRSPEDKTALVDAGPSNHVVSLLRERGIRALDLVVLSHHHADHYGGMLAVVRQFHPRVFLASDSPHTTEHYLKLLEAVRDQGIRAIGPTNTTRKIALGSVTLSVLPEAPRDPKEENNNSIGLRVDYGRFSALLPGDAQETERLWWERRVPTLCADATVLKLAHHGSRNGTDARWLNLVHPRLAVASLGAHNEFGHPHIETLALLERYQIPFLRTDRDGTVTIRTDGQRWSISSHPHIATDAPAATAQHPSTRRREGAAAGRADHRLKSKQPDTPVELNTASADELRTLPGIGEVLARRIIAGRPYESVDDLGQIDGIGPKRLAEIRPFVRVR